MSTILERTFDHLWYRGKVRDIYQLPQWLFIDLPGEKLLMHATNRISAFDVVLPTEITDKGKILTLLSVFWFKQTSTIVPNHLISLVSRTWLDDSVHGKHLLRRFERQWHELVKSVLANRSMIVKRAQRIDIECVVRGYLSGSAWEEYSRTGRVCGYPLPPGLVESQELPSPLFTPTTKADAGHDIPLTQAQLHKLIGEKLAIQLQEKTLAIYSFAHDYALGRGIIIADTKMEFGLVEGQLTIIDELLTPDSSRFWDAHLYSPGHSQPSFDKQPVRDWLLAQGWNKEPPAPPLPPEVVAQTTGRYQEAYRRLTGRPLPP